MAKRRKTKRKGKKVSFKLGTSKKKKKVKTTEGPSLKSILRVVELVCVIAAATFIFYFLEKYVRTVKPVHRAALELVDVPEWVNEALQERIYQAAVAYGETIEVDETAARTVQQNIEELVRWVDDVRVLTTHDRLLIAARWRRPVALVEWPGQTCYVDNELVALDFVPMPNLPIVLDKQLNRISFTLENRTKDQHVTVLKLSVHPSTMYEVLQGGQKVSLTKTANWDYPWKAELNMDETPSKIEIIRIKQP